MPSFSIPLSGLDAAQSALSVVANNLSNMNTVGYKDETVNFRDLFYQSIGTNGAGEALQVGAGSAVQSVSANFTGGNIASTGVPTDVAINGNGFLVTQENGQNQYTRAGNLMVNSNGYLSTQDGQTVMGFAASNGVVSNTTLSPLQVGTGSTVPASATSSLQMSMNLDATAAVGSTFSKPLPVYDSLGTAHSLSFQFTKTGPNTWSYTATVPDTDLSIDPTTGLPVVPTIPSTQLTVGSGTMGFDSSGNLATVNGVNINPTGGPALPNITGIALNNLTDKAANMNLNWTVLNSSSNSLIKQTAAASAVSTMSQNGFSSGTLNSFSVNPDGTIEGAYSNGQTLALGQLVLAQFANENGLNRIGNNSYQATATSGTAVVGNPGNGGLGTLTGGALEQSNVDLATEFSRMITNQRGFEANAKVITAFDTITQDTINIQR